MQAGSDGTRIEQKINGTPDNSMVGEYWINISAEDDQLSYDFINFTVEVLNRSSFNSDQ